MQKINIQPRQYNFLFIAILVLLLPLCIYYFFYVPGQRSYFTERYFRVLGIISTNIDSKIENQQKVLRNAAGNARYGGLFADRQIKQAIQLAENMEMVKPPRIFQSKEAVPEKVKLWVEKVGNRTWLYYDYTTTFSNAYYKSLNLGVELNVRSDLNKLLQPLVINDLFENILLIQQDGSVVYLQDDRELKISRLDTIVSVTGEEKEQVLKTHIARLYDVPLGGKDFKMFVQPLTTPFLSERKLTNLKPAEVAVCGLIPAGHFNSKNLSINYLFILGFMFLILAVVLSWPLLKIVFISAHDRLRISDILLLIISMLLGAGLLTFLTFSFFSYFSMTEKMDHDLSKLADTIESNFDREILNAYQQLQSYDSNFFTDNSRVTQLLKEKKKTNILQNPKADFYPAKYPYLEMVYWMDRTGQQKIKWSVRSQTTSLINVGSRNYFKKIKLGHAWHRELPNGDLMNYWIEPIYSWNTGENLAVISSPIETDSLKVAALVSRPVSIMKPVLPAGFGYCIINKDGEVLFHSDERRNLKENLFEESDDDRWLISAVLGRSSRNGNVRYLGKGYRFLVKPLKDLPWSLVVFRNKEIFRTINLEVLTIAFLLFTGYTLLFFLLFGAVYLLRPGYRAEWAWPDPMQTNTYIALALAYIFIAVLFLTWILFAQSFQILQMVIVFPLIALMLTFFLMKTYPKENRCLTGAVYGLLLLIFILNLLINILFFPNLLRTIIYSLLLIFLFPGVRIFRNRLAEKQNHAGWYPYLFPLLLVLLLVISGLFPSLAFLKFSFQEHIRLFVKHAQISMVKNLEERDSRIRDDFRKLTAGPDLLKQRRSLQEKDVYTDFFFNSTTQITPGDKFPAQVHEGYLTGVRHVISKLIPLYNKITIESRGLIDNISADSLWAWHSVSKSGKPNQLVLTKRWYRDNQPVLIHIRSELPAMIPNRIQYINLTILFIPLFILLFLLMRYITKRIFLIKLDESTLIESIDITSLESIDQNMILIGPPFSGKTQFLADKLKSTIDLTQLRKGSDPLDLIDSQKLAEPQPIVLDHFEFRIKDPEYNRKKLALLESLIYTHHQTVVISSTVDPNSYLTTEPTMVKGTTDEENLRERWINVLGSFVPYFYQNTGNIKEFDKLIRKYQMKYQRAYARKEPKTAEKATALLRLLFHECMHNKTLQKVGAKIAASADFSELNREELINQVHYWAGNYYQALWSTFIKEEQLLLLYLAQNSFVNSKSSYTLWRLMERNIVVRDPVLRLFNKSFTQFVLKKQTAPEIRAWTKEAKSRSPWGRLKTPMVIVLLGLTFFLFTTQPEAFDTSFGVLTAIAAAIPTVLRLLDFFQRNKQIPEEK